MFSNADPDKIKIKLLRDKFNCPLLKCKQALIEANGDIEKAAQILRKEITESMRRFGAILDGDGKWFR